MQAINAFFESLRETMITISATIAVIGMLGGGMAYTLSGMPILSEWKQSHPKMLSDIAIGLVIIAFAASGGVVALLGIGG